jgi:hypothetical protein
MPQIHEVHIKLLQDLIAKQREIYVKEFNKQLITSTTASTPIDVGDSGSMVAKITAILDDLKTKGMLPIPKYSESYIPPFKMYDDMLYKENPEKISPSYMKFEPPNYYHHIEPANLSNKLPNNLVTPLYGGLKVISTLFLPMKTRTVIKRIPAHPWICWLAKYLPITPYTEINVEIPDDDTMVIWRDQLICSPAQLELLRQQGIKS